MELLINGKSEAAELSIETMVLYEHEFDGADMIADLNGKVRTNDEEEGVLFDFAKVPWLKIMQGAWAMLKTANPKLPHFRKWAASVKEVNAFEMRSALQEAVSDGFFHTAASPEEG